MNAAATTQTLENSRAGSPTARHPVTTATAINSRQRFLNACHCRPVDRPPMWLMRQAGRALPEYRALKEKWSFLELVQTPELAAEVTLQPVRRFGFDAAILFSDILVVSEAMGQGYRFREGGGIEMDFALNSATDLDRLEDGAIRERLDYVDRALPLVKRELGGGTALLGFVGSPWTLANFMLEGGSAKQYVKAEALFYSDPPLFARLMEKLARAVTEFLQLQIEAGVDAVQILPDSLGGLLPDDAFAMASARWMEEIIAALPRETPVIVFAKGANGNWPALVRTRAKVLGVDWTVPLAGVKAGLPANMAVQGNLDPALLTTTPALVAQETRRILESMRGYDGHIFNLGHGVPPDAKLDNIQVLADTVRNFK